MATTGLEPFTRFQSLLNTLFDSQPFPFPANRNREDCPHWLLALTISFSRSDRARTDLIGVGAGLSRRTVPDVLQLLESLLRTPEGLGAYPAGLSPYQAHTRGSTRSGTKRPNPGRHPAARPLLAMLPAPPASAADIAGPTDQGFLRLRRRQCRHRRPHPGWRAVSHSGPPHATWCRVSGVQQASRPPLCANSEPPGERAPPVATPRPTASTVRASQAFCTSGVASP
jgi:hypothetical protein